MPRAVPSHILATEKNGPGGGVAGDILSLQHETSIFLLKTVSLGPKGLQYRKCNPWRTCRRERLTSVPACHPPSPAGRPVIRSLRRVHIYAFVYGGYSSPQA